LKNNVGDEAMYAYFLGYMTHYAADSQIHPFVYYYIEHRMNKKFDPILNNCLHVIIETEMDTYVGHNYLKGAGADTFYRFKCGKANKELVRRHFLEINKDVFDLPLTFKDIKESIFFMKLLMFLCQRHKNGSARFYLIELIDKFLKADHLLMSALRPRELDRRYDYLNLEKKPYDAVYKSEDEVKENMSFPEMIDAAIGKGIRLIGEANAHIFEGKPMPKESFRLTYNGTINDELKIEN